MTKEQAIVIAAAYFPTYPKVDTFYVTHDEQVFEDATQAGNHARMAFKKDEEREVVTVLREDVPGADTTLINAEAQEKADAIAKAQDGVKELSKTLKAKQKAFDKAGDDKKADAQSEVEAAETALKVAEVELEKLLEGAE